MTIIDATQAKFPQMPRDSVINILIQCRPLVQKLQKEGKTPEVIADEVRKVIVPV